MIFKYHFKKNYTIGKQTVATMLEKILATSSKHKKCSYIYRKSVKIVESVMSSGFHEKKRIPILKK